MPTLTTMKPSRGWGTRIVAGSSEERETAGPFPFGFAQGQDDNSKNKCLELEAVAEFGVELAGIVVVEAAEGEAVVEEDSGVAYVQGVEGDGEVFAEVLA